MRLYRSKKQVQFSMWSIGFISITKKKSTRSRLNLNGFSIPTQAQPRILLRFLAMLSVVFVYERLHCWVSSIIWLKAYIQVWIRIDLKMKYFVGKIWEYSHWIVYFFIRKPINILYQKLIFESIDQILTKCQ